MKRFVRNTAIALVLVIPACSAKVTPLAQTLVAAESYETTQIAIEAAVMQPSIDAEVKATLQRIDREMMAALHSMRDAAVAGNEDRVRFYSDLTARLLMQLRPILADELLEE